MSQSSSLLKDPAARPRLILWLLSLLFAFAAFFVVSQMVTSTKWFCNDVCHVVHQDNAAQYFSSSHAEVSCIACHYPVGLGPIAFTLDRVDKLLDIPPTITGDFEMPLNGDSHLALTIPDEQCTQCHSLATREVTPTKGIRINHDIHTQNGVVCAACHNRVAHPEKGYEFQLPGNGPKADFMTMTACYRCHSLTMESPSGYWGPGECNKCHTEGFDLIPPSHDEAGWYTERGESAGHASAAKAEASRTAEAQAEWEAEKDEFYEKGPRLLVRLAGIDESLKTDVPPPGTIDECFTCHIRAEFCDACHGVEVPHTAEFVSGHGTGLSPTRDASSCGVCHNDTGKPANDPYTCTLCHHPAFDPTVGTPWQRQHDDNVKASGSGPCFECHDRDYCADCHINRALQD